MSFINIKWFLNFQCDNIIFYRRNQNNMTRRNKKIPEINWRVKIITNAIEIIILISQAATTTISGSHLLDMFVSCRKYFDNDHRSTECAITTESNWDLQRGTLMCAPSPPLSHSTLSLLLTHKYRSSLMNSSIWISFCFIHYSVIT